MTVPLRVFAPDARTLSDHASALRLPLWIPWPLPSGWQIAGHGYVGDDATGTVLACRGPNPMNMVDIADMLIITDEPGTGLGGTLAGLDGSDAGPGFGTGSPHAKAFVGDRPTSLWWVKEACTDRAVYAGEAAGRWLWVILFPDSAGAMMAEPLVLAEVRELGREVDLLPFGNLSPRLAPY